MNHHENQSWEDEEVCGEVGNLELLAELNVEHMARYWWDGGDL